MVAAYPCGVHSSAGKPTYQQDRHIIRQDPNVSLYAVADGHGSPEHGHYVSDYITHAFPRLLQQHNVFSYASQPASLRTQLRSVVSKLDNACITHTSKHRVYAGSTLCAVLHTGNVLHCVNVGDSRAVVVTSCASTRALTQDHLCSVPAERKRIERAGGVVVGGLLNGYISMSRAIGDDDLKGHRQITPFPVHGKRNYGEDMFIGDADVTTHVVGVEDVVAVIASDGVWGKLSNRDVGNVVKSEIGRGKNANQVAKAVVKKAIAKGSRDNVTAVVVFLWSEEAVRNAFVPVRKQKQRYMGTKVKADGLQRVKKDGSSWDSNGTSSTISSDVLDMSGVTRFEDRPRRKKERDENRAMKFAARVRSNLR